MKYSEKSLMTLELDRILEMLAEEAASEDAKEAAKALRPSGDYDIAELLMSETSCAKKMMVMNGSPPIGAIKNIGGSLARAEAGGCLSTTELLAAAAVFRSAREAISYAAQDKGEPGVLSGRFSALTANRSLEERITGSYPRCHAVSSSTGWRVAARKLPQ